MCRGLGEEKLQIFALPSLEHDATTVNTTSTSIALLKQAKPRHPIAMIYIGSNEGRGLGSARDIPLEYFAVAAATEDAVG